MKKVSALCVLIILALISTSYADFKKIAVLPMKINAAQDYSFLQSGIMDMLSSRLAWKNRLEVIGKSQTLAAVKDYGKELDQQGAAAVAKSLGADYAVFGSLTVLGKSVSIDAKILDVAEDSVVDSVFTQAKTMDDVIPQVDNFAQSINSKVFGRQTETAEAQPEKAAATEENKPAQEEQKASPLLAPAYMASPTEKIRISSLNPAFTMAGDSAGKEAVWRSRNLPYAVRGLDVGDIDGDGKNELVTIGPRSLFVYRKTEQGLVEMAKDETGMFDFFLSVDVADLDGDGKAEIYTSREKGASGVANSAVYEWIDNKLVATITGSSWYFRVINFPEEGPGLIGQHKRTGEGFITTKVYRLSKQGDKIVEGEALRLPRNTYVYNFNYATFKGVTRIVRINAQDYLQVLDNKGESLWEGDTVYGGTVNYVIKNEENAFTSEMTGRIYFPARIVVTDLNDDGDADIVVNKNKSTTFRITERYRIFSSGNIVCLSWGGMGLRENWTTTKIPGYVPDYTIKDLDNDGNPDLVTCLVRMDPTGMKDGNSSVVAFTLKKQDKSEAAQTPVTIE